MKFLAFIYLKWCILFYLKKDVNKINLDENLDNEKDKLIKLSEKINNFKF